MCLNGYRGYRKGTACRTPTGFGNKQATGRHNLGFLSLSFKPQTIFLIQPTDQVQGLIPETLLDLCQGILSVHRI